MSWGKRILRSLLLLAFLGSLLWAAISFSAQRLAEETEPESESASGVCRIRITYPVYEDVTKIEDLPEVQEAVNDITVEKIGVEVELVPVDMSGIQDDYLLWLGRGEQFDLMLVRGQDIATYIDKDLILPLDSYLQRSAAHIGNKNNWTGGTLSRGAEMQGRIYGIACLSGQEANGYGLWISGSLLTESGFAYDPDHIYTLEELDLLFASLKERYPDSYPLGQITSGQTSSSAGYYTILGDALGRDILTGVVQNESDAVINPFETLEYYGFLTYMRQWYEEGYIYPDSVIYDASVLELLKERRILTFPASSYPGTFSQIVGKETDYVCLRTTEVSRQSGVDGYLTIPATSRYPEQAAEFLDLLYSDRKLAYLLNYGISGEHYEITDWERGLLEPVRDADGNPEGFYNPFARIGDISKLYSFGTAVDDIMRNSYVAGAKNASTRYSGFIYDTTSVSRQIDDVREVIREYTPILECGCVELDANYTTFLNRLREAGIDEILADKQAQLDAWLIRQGLKSAM